MKYLLYILVIILLLSFNIGFFSFFKIYGVAPNLLFLYLIFSSTERDSYDFFILAFICGFLTDLFSASVFGSFTLAFLIIAFCINQVISKVIIFDLKWKHWIAILALSELLLFLIISAYSLFGVKLGWAVQVWDFKVLGQKLVIEFFYNLILLYPTGRVVSLVRFVNNKVLNKRRVAN